jgi:hypothetical protein
MALEVTRAPERQHPEIGWRFCRPHRIRHPGTGREPALM